jgi:hypothetical protein
VETTRTESLAEQRRHLRMRKHLSKNLNEYLVMNPKSDSTDTKKERKKEERERD